VVTFAAMFPTLRSKLYFWWLTREKEGLVFVAMLAAPVGLLAAIVWFAYSDGMENNARQRVAREEVERKRDAELQCLAENVYYEARGEPMSGQYAVAEVTLNRVRSPYYPDTICEVVHQSHWDPARKRRTAAFSWTALDIDGTPRGRAWRQAKKAASAVYNNTHTPVVPEALFYHATYVDPYWAKTRKHVATIGNHAFYR